ncbi:MAG: glycerophosphodiester phosphodiesterase [Actinomycetota bacterium]
MPHRRRIACAIALLALPLLVAGALPGVAQTAENPWPGRRILNIAHRGGANEAPENTIFAYQKALDAGADLLEMDIYETSDGELVVIHDSSVDRTTNGSGGISSLTLAQVKALDAGYWYAAGRGTTHDAKESEYLYRGMATEKQPPPPAFGPNDFRIPTLREILQRFPGVWINIEMKPQEEKTGSYELKLAALLAEFARTDDVIVVSFLDHHLEMFKAAAPEVSTAAGTGQVAAFWTSSQGPLPGSLSRYHALQVPPTLGVTVITPDFVADAHANGLAVHVWTINECREMVDLLKMGVDGIMTDAPSVLEKLLVMPEGAWSCQSTATSAGASDRPAAAPRVAASHLPATGGSLGLVGAALLGATVLMRRCSRRPHP